MDDMNGGGNHTASGRHRSIEVSQRQALALLAALELAPFEDEALTRKLLEVVYKQGNAAHTERRPRSNIDFAHHRRR